MKAVTGNEAGQSSPSQDRPSLVLTRCPEWLSLNLSLCSGRKGKSRRSLGARGACQRPSPTTLGVPSSLQQRAGQPCSETSAGHEIRRAVCSLGEGKQRRERTHAPRGDLLERGARAGSDCARGQARKGNRAWGRPRWLALLRWGPP